MPALMLHLDLYNLHRNVYFMVKEYSTEQSLRGFLDGRTIFVFGRGQGDTVSVIQDHHDPTSYQVAIYPQALLDHFMTALELS